MHSQLEVYGDAIMRLWHIRMWCRVQSSKKIHWISMMISLVCLAHQGWTLLQHEWSKWSGKTEKSQFKIIPLCWSWPSELYINTVHNELGYCDVCALCVPRCHKRAKINVLRLLFLIFSGLKKTEISSWNPQWQVTGHQWNIWHMKQNKLEWRGNTQLPWQSMRKFTVPDLDICYEVWSFGVKMQPHTAYIRHMSFCGHFTGNFLLPPPYK